MKEKVLNHIVCYKNVGISVAVIVGECNAQSAPPRRGDAGCDAHILKGAIAAVVIKNVGNWRKFRWRTIRRLFVITARLAFFYAPIEITRDKKIQLPVVIVIEKSCRNRPPSRGHPSLRGDIRKVPSPLLWYKIFFP